MSTTINSNRATFGMTSTDNPLTVNAGVTIYSNYFADGVYTDASLKHWTITNAGTIESASIGIHVIGAIDLTNASSGLISGRDYGVQSYNGYKYASHILNQGTIHGGYFGYGLKLPSGGTVVNSGTVALVSSSGAGIFLGHHGVVLNGGTIQASRYAAVLLDGTGRVKNIGRHAVIEGHTQAIYARHGIISVYNSGSINAGDGTAVDLAKGGTVFNAATGRITAHDNAVRANGAPLTLTNYGTLAASTYNGIFFQAGGTVSNLGRAAHITGGEVGVWDHGGDAGIYNQGTITGLANYGIRFDGAGTLHNASRHALVMGGTDGVLATQAASIMNHGSIRGSTDGIVLPSGQVDNRHGATISGASRGISATDSGDLTVINAGTISSLNKGIYTNSGGLSLTNSGLVTADFVAVYGYKFAAVSNAGTIIASTGDGIRSRGLGDVTNASAGLISGYTTAISLAGADSTVINRGTITTNGAYATAISLAGDGNTVVNHGIITTTNLYANAISVAGTGTIVNSGSIHGSTDAVALTSGVVRNLAGGAITGGTHAIHASANATIVNAGQLHGGINAGADVLLTNKAGGTVSGVTAVYGKNGASAVNAGRIDGSGWGIFAATGDVSVDNTGSISGAFAAVYGYNHASVANAGTISSSGGAAIRTGGGADITNAATGLITGGQWGVYIAPGAGASTVVNRGTILGDPALGGAVHLPDHSDNRFTTYRDAVTVGVVLGGAYYDQLAFGASPGPAGTIAGFGTHYVSFEAIALEDNARWILPAIASLPVVIDLGTGATLRAHGALVATDQLTLTGPGTLDLRRGHLEVGMAGLARAGELVVDATHTLLSTAALEAGRARNLGSILDSSLHFTGDAAVTNRGLITGPGQSVLFDGVGSLLNTGSIHGDTDGVVFASGSVDNRHGATISAGTHGIMATNTDATVTNAGLIHGDLNAIWAGRDIALVNQESGVLTSDIPVWSYWSVSATNAGEIIGTNKGIYTDNGGLNLTNSGTVSGTNQGVYGCQYAALSNSGVILSSAGKAIVSHTWVHVTNSSAGLISGYTGAIEADNSGSTIVNHGTIVTTGTDANAIDLAFNGTVINSGLISASSNGIVAPTILVRNLAGGTITAGGHAIRATSSDATVTNAGSLHGDLNAVYTLLNVALVNKSGGRITGDVPVWGTNGVSITNAGTIAGTTKGIVAQTGGLVLTNSGTVSGAAAGIFGYVYAHVTNAGQITASTGTAIATHATADVTNLFGGVISGYADGITAGLDGSTIVNHGTIATTGTDANAVSLAGSGTVINSGSIHGSTDGVRFTTGLVRNQAGGTITAGFHAVSATNGDATVVNAGLLDGGLNAIFASGNISITNEPGATLSADIPVWANYGVSASNAGEIIGLTKGIYTNNGGLSLTNSGIVSGASQGVYGCLNAVVFNSGTISASTGKAIFSHTWANVTNTASGLISGYQEGIFANNTGSTIVNQGTIAATASVGESNGIDLNLGIATISNAATGLIAGGDWGIYVNPVGGATTIANRGTITGGVHFSDADGNLFTTYRGAHTTGAVRGGAGYDVLALGASPGPFGTITGLGSHYTGFEALTLNDQARWVMPGTASLPVSVINVGHLATLRASGGIVANANLTLGGDGTIDLRHSRLEVGVAGLAKIGDVVVDAFYTLDTSVNFQASRVRNFGSITGGPLSLALDAEVINHGSINGTGNAVVGSYNLQVDNFGAINGANDGVFGTDVTFTNHNHAGIFGEIAVYGCNGVHGINSGSIAGTFRGIYSYQAGVTLTNTGEVFGGTSGITALSATVTNSGSITSNGTSGTGISVGVANVTNTAGGLISGGSGIAANALAPSTVVNAGTIYAYASLGAGIFFEGGGTIVNAASGTIRGSDHGIQSYGTLGVLNHGRIEGDTGSGVVMHGGRVVNSGPSATIYGLHSGIYDATAPVTVINRGTITSPIDTGMLLKAGGLVSNVGTAASIYGGGWGIHGSGGAVRVINEGTIKGGSVAGLDLFAGGALVNSGTVSGGSFGVQIYAFAGTIRNQGTIVGNSGLGIALYQGGTIANQGTASDIGGGNFGIYASAGVLSLTNEGTIQATGKAAVRLQSGSVENIGTASSLSGGLYGVYVASGAGTVTNQGSIHGNAHAVILANGGTIANLGTDAVITGGDYGVFTFNSGAAASITNQGTIAGAANGGIYLGRGGNVTNLGTASSITGGQFGVVGWNVAPSIDNHGTIIGTSDSGIFLDAGGTVENLGISARIQGGSYGIDAHLSAGATTIVNHGLITGGAGAIRFGNANGNLLDIIPGAIDSGAVRGGSGTDTLELSKGPGAGTLASLGAQFTGFETLTLDAGAKWHLIGANPADALDEIDVAAGASLLVSGTLTTPGNLTIDSPGIVSVLGTGRIEIGAGGLAHAGQVMIDSGNTLTTSGTIEANTVRVAGTLLAAADLTLQGDVSGNGRISITPNTVLTVTGTLGAQDVVFLPGGPQTIVLDNATPSNFHGFHLHDTIDLVGLGAFVSKSYDTTTHLLSIAGSLGNTTLQFAGIHTDAEFLVNTSGANLLVTHAP